MIRPSSPLTMLLSRHTRRREFIVRRARDGTEDLTGRVLLLQRLPNLPLCFGKLPPSLVSVVPRLVKLAGARFELLFQLDRWIGLVANARSRFRSGRAKFAARWTICAFARQDHLVGTVTGPPSGRPSQRSSLSILTEPREETRASSCVDGPRLARENVACRTEVACSHVSGLFTQSRWTAGPDGVREPRPHHSSGIDVPMKSQASLGCVGSTDCAITRHCSLASSSPSAVGD